MRQIQARWRHPRQAKLDKMQLLLLLLLKEWFQLLQTLLPSHLLKLRRKNPSLKLRLLKLQRMPTQ